MQIKRRVYTHTARLQSSAQYSALHSHMNLRRDEILRQNRHLHLLTATVHDSLDFEERKISKKLPTTPISKSVKIHYFLLSHKVKLKLQPLMQQLCRKIIYTQ